MSGSPYRIAERHDVSAADPAWRTAAAALTVLFVARLLRGALSLTDCLAFQLMRRCRYMLEDEFFLDEVLRTTGAAARVADLAIIGVFVALASLLHRSRAGLAVRIALLLTFVQWCIDAMFLYPRFRDWTFSEDHADLLFCVEYVGRALAALAFVIALRTIRRLASSARGTTSGGACPWSVAEKVALASVVLHFGLLHGPAWLPESVWSVPLALFLMRHPREWLLVALELLVLPQIYAARHAAREALRPS